MDLFTKLTLSMETETRAQNGSARASYEAIAPVYDQFTADYDLELWLSGILAGLESVGLSGRRLLLLGLGDNPQGRLLIIGVVRIGYRGNYGDHPDKYTVSHLEHVILLYP